MKQYIALILAYYTLFVACNSTKEFVDNDALCNYDDPLKSTIKTIFKPIKKL